MKSTTALVLLPLCLAHLGAVLAVPLSTLHTKPLEELMEEEKQVQVAQRQQQLAALQQEQQKAEQEQKEEARHIGRRSVDEKAVPEPAEPRIAPSHTPHVAHLADDHHRKQRPLAIVVVDVTLPRPGRDEVAAALAVPRPLPTSYLESLTAPSSSADAKTLLDTTAAGELLLAVASSSIARIEAGLEPEETTSVPCHERAYYRNLQSLQLQRYLAREYTDMLVVGLVLTFLAVVVLMEVSEFLAGL